MELSQMKLAKKTYRVVLTRTITETVVIDAVDFEKVEEKPSFMTKINEYMDSPGFIEQNKLEVSRTEGAWTIAEKTENK